jgi:cellobiose PTS system EIIB component
MLSEMKNSLNGKIPVGVIAPMHYGLCNGEEVLKDAIKLFKGE